MIQHQIKHTGRKLVRCPRLISNGVYTISKISKIS